MGTGSKVMMVHGIGHEKVDPRVAAECTGLEIVTE